VVEESRELLYAARAKRPPPLRDEKVLAAWNGLMIGAHSRAALVLGDERYAPRATRAADFVLTRMRKDGRLLRSQGWPGAPQRLPDDYVSDRGLLTSTSRPASRESWRWP
jgi:uncharacterized protein YyaL (SSP411 family)